MTVDKSSQPAEGRVTELVSIVNFLLVKKDVIVLGGCLNSIMLRAVGLDYDLPT